MPLNSPDRSKAQKTEKSVKRSTQSLRYMLFAYEVDNGQSPICMASKCIMLLFLIKHVPMCAQSWLIILPFKIDCSGLRMFLLCRLSFFPAPIFFLFLSRPTALFPLASSRSFFLSLLSPIARSSSLSHQETGSFSLSLPRSKIASRHKTGIEKSNFSWLIFPLQKKKRLYEDRFCRKFKGSCWIPAHKYTHQSIVR